MNNIENVSGMDATFSDPSALNGDALEMGLLLDEPGFFLSMVGAGHYHTEWFTTKESAEKFINYLTLLKDKSWPEENRQGSNCISNTRLAE